MGDSDKHTANVCAPGSQKKFQKNPEFFGIDFGNSNICVSYCQNNVFHIVQLEAKTTTMPAIITLNDEDFFVGNDAINTQTKKATTLTMFDFRHIFSSDNPPNSTFPFFITKNMDFESATEPSFHPIPLVRAIAILFQWIKNKIKSDLEMEMINIVITAPTGFDLNQRQLIVNAAKIAELKVTHIINEPIAVAISYFIANPKESKEFCVFDFGGSKLEIAIVKTDSKNIELVDCISDLQLGGRDFDEILFKYVCGIIAKENPHIKLKSKDFTQIRQECIKAKVNLGTTSTITIDIGISEEDVTIPLKVTEFESLCNKLLNRIENLIATLKNRNHPVNDVVLIGGSTRIPMVQTMLSRYFETINKSLNADEAVAKGAAAFPMLLSKTLEKINIADCIPWNEKINSAPTKMEYFIDKDDVVRQKVYSNATNVEFDLKYEKEMVDDLFNKKEEKASKYARKQIPHAPEQLPQIYNVVEALIQRSQMLSLECYKDNIEDLLKAAGIYKTNFDNFKAYGHKHAGELENRLQRVEAYLSSLELLVSISEFKQYKKETQDFQNVVSYLYENSLKLEQSGLNRFTSYIYLMGYWLKLQENIKVFEGTLKALRINGSKTCLPQIKNEANNLKNAIGQFGCQKGVHISDEKYKRINDLVAQFLSQYPAAPVSPTASHTGTDKNKGKPK